jgi:ligand-binding SRPBCC domain-containing protein
MRVHELHREQLVRRPLDETFAFFAEASNLERITPQWLRFEVATPGPIAMATGTRIDYRLRLHGLPIRWSARIEDWRPGREFVDRQIRGPYRLWHHRHAFARHPDGTLVTDHVRYALPAGPLGEAAHALLVRRDLDRIFSFRAAAVERELSQLVTA